MRNFIWITVCDPWTVFFLFWKYINFISFVGEKIDLAALVGLIIHSSVVRTSHFALCEFVLYSKRVRRPPKHNTTESRKRRKQVKKNCCRIKNASSAKETGYLPWKLSWISGERAVFDLFHLSRNESKLRTRTSTFVHNTLINLSDSV